MLYCGVELFQIEDTKEFLEYQTALVKRNKDILLVVVIAAGAFINAWKLYEKVLMEKEKRRGERLDNDLKEKQLKDDTKTDIQ